MAIYESSALDYYFLENQGTDIAITRELSADVMSRDLLWYGGPVTPDVLGGVIAKYPDGNPAIIQIWSGNGFMTLSGVHPAAPQSIRESLV